ncbi:MAG: hypothetical protein JXR34_07585 [Bacteroidales bacterium]|nr:hypothetical protein [Bacteroidales bacterium]
MREINNIERKQRILDYAKQIVKSEFFGIDQVIEQIFDAYSNWYLFNDFQDFPTVINLWGMTGVGKTSVVKRIVQLTGMEKQFKVFESKEKFRYSNSIYNEDGDRFVETELPYVFLFDEFQKWRTKDEKGIEDNNDEGTNSTFWSLIDTGEIYLGIQAYRIFTLKTLIVELEYLVSNGVRVKNGIVVEQVELFREKMIRYYQNERPPRFIPENEVLDLVELYKDVIKNPILMVDMLMSMNERETLQFLHKIITYSRKPKRIDLSKSVFFIVGNIDEAYQINKDLNPDMSADEFFDYTQRITIYNIKKALLDRFRSEQISRMGNIIINYPSLNSAAYKSIINKELNLLSEKVAKKLKVNLVYSQKFKELIYLEGVFPTQGARPVLSTINYLAKSNLNKIISKVLRSKTHITKIVVDYENENLIVNYFSGETSIMIENQSVDLKVENVRRPARDDMQAIVAVHESGHAVLAGVLLRILPNFIVSTPAANDIQGFTNYNQILPYTSKLLFHARTAVFLGGLMAERLVFGDNYITDGSESDILKATNFVSDLVKQSGFHTSPIAIQVEDHRVNDFYFDESGEMNRTIREIIDKAAQLAMNTLSDNYELLLRMADLLSEKSRVDKNELRQLFENYYKNYRPDFFIENPSNLYYRFALKEKILDLESNGQREKLSLDDFEKSFGDSGF